MNSKISLEQALKAYQVMHAPSKFSWKQHYAQEKFSSDDYLSCSEDEKEQFKKRLRECSITLTKGIKSTSGEACTLENIVEILTNPANKNIKKIDRSVVYSTSDGTRPTGNAAYDLWNGWQVIDMDIKDHDMAKALKLRIFKALHKCNWFMGVTYSASGLGLHIYTKIAIPETLEVPIVKGAQVTSVTDTEKKKLL